MPHVLHRLPPDPVTVFDVLTVVLFVLLFPLLEADVNALFEPLLVTFGPRQHVLAAKLTRLF